MIVAILDLSPKRGFVIGGFGGLFCWSTPATNTFQVRKRCIIFVQAKSLYSGTTRGHSYEDIGTQVRATQSE